MLAWSRWHLVQRWRGGIWFRGGLAQALTVARAQVRVIIETGASRGSCEIGWGAKVLSGDGESNWSRRYKANLEKLASGDLVKVVQVVRDLAEQDAIRALSAGEKRMLARARLILLQEG